jgi:hypothetical protein
LFRLPKDQTTFLLLIQPRSSIEQKGEKMKNFKLSKKTYLTAFVFVMALNVCLAVFLIRNVFAQTTADKLKDQPPIVAEVLEQKDSPLLITVNNVDNSDESYQTVKYVVQNIGSKSVRTFTVYSNGRNTGQVIINSLALKSLQTNEFKEGQVFIERENIKPDEKILLSVDYVVFEDGSSWGNDTQQKSKEITGEWAGRKFAVQYFKELIKNRDITTLTNVLEQEVAEISIPPIDSNQTEEWEKGFQRGYKSVVAILQQNKKQGTNALSAKLDEIEKIAK